MISSLRNTQRKSRKKISSCLGWDKAGTLLGGFEKFFVNVYRFLLGVGKSFNVDCGDDCTTV